MEKEYVLQIAQTIKEQLVGMTPAPVIMSWGITEFAATIYRDLPALRIKLNGRLHTGYVMIVLNGSDYYEVYLLSGSATECVSKEVCFDELGDVIDRAVESGTDQAEYEEFCRQQLGKLLSGQTARHGSNNSLHRPYIRTGGVFVCARFCRGKTSFYTSRCERW